MASAPLILSVETATLAGSVSLVRGDEVLTTISGDNQVSHSNRLLSEIETALNQTGHSLADIDLFAVATGPGSFTGLRIGIATVKGLAYTLSKPCVGIPTLQAVAYSARNCEKVVAVLPAGRGEVFVQLYQVSDDDVIASEAATHIDPTTMLEKYTEYPSICWCGEGANMHSGKIKDWAERNQRSFTESAQSGDSGQSWRLLPKTAGLSEQVAALAFRRANEKQFQTPEALSAIYVRPSDAELKAKPAK